MVYNEAVTKALLSSEAVVEIAPGGPDDSYAREVLRCLRVLYGTHAGEQGLDRDFGLGCDMTDYPQPGAQALFAAEVVRKTAKYEPRAQVMSVQWIAGDEDKGRMRPKVVVSIV